MVINTTINNRIPTSGRFGMTARTVDTNYRTAAITGSGRRSQHQQKSIRLSAILMKQEKQSSSKAGEKAFPLQSYENEGRKPTRWPGWPEFQCGLRQGVTPSSAAKAHHDPRVAQHPIPGRSEARATKAGAQRGNKSPILLCWGQRRQDETCTDSVYQKWRPGGEVGGRPLPGWRGGNMGQRREAPVCSGCECDNTVTIFTTRLYVPGGQGPCPCNILPAHGIRPGTH